MDATLFATDLNEDTDAFQLISKCEERLSFHTWLWHSLSTPLPIELFPGSITGLEDQITIYEGNRD